MDFYCNYCQASIFREKKANLIKNCPDLQIELVGSWGVSVGDQDQFLHICRYKGGYSTIDKSGAMLKNNQDAQSLLKERAGYLRSRHSQFILPFSYWPEIKMRTGNSIYEVRSYTLKPGTMIEWGNNWARAINFRRENEEAFAGFFSQVGRLYQVHHFWTYADLQTRKETRESAWRKPGWDECVAYTVPLIKKMESRILYPLSFSPTH
ncbi:protein NipSnap-like [Artemia franciscana]|uniref:protein NipSnap-like n=1 Tax=Artemia franciscana TaxID=6661 RepID=UPI0032DBE151